MVLKTCEYLGLSNGQSQMVDCSTTARVNEGEVWCSCQRATWLEETGLCHDDEKVDRVICCIGLRLGWQVDSLGLSYHIPVAIYAHWHLQVTWLNYTINKLQSTDQQSHVLINKNNWTVKWDRNWELDKMPTNGVWVADWGSDSAYQARIQLIQRLLCHSQYTLAF